MPNTSGQSEVELLGSMYDKDRTETQETTTVQETEATTVDTEETTTAEETEQAEETEETQTITNSEQETEAESTEETVSDFGNQINEWSDGRFETNEEALQELFDIHSQNNELVDNLETLQTENDQLKEQQNSAPKFSSPLSEKINEYIASGGKDLGQFVQLQNTDVDGLSDKDVIALSKQINEGYSSKDAKFVVESRFTLDEDATPKQTELARIELEREAESARKSLGESKLNDLTPYSVAESQEAETAETQRIESWDNASNDIANEISTMEINLSEDEALTIELSGDELSQYQEDIKWFVNSQQGLKPDQQGLANVKEFVKGKFIIDNISNIISEAQKAERARLEEKNFVDDHKPSAKDQTQEQRDSQTQSKSMYDQVRDIENM